MLSIQDYTKKVLGMVKGYVQGYSPDNKLLARPIMYMVGSHTVTLSEPVSAQKHGIVLLFTEYSNGSPKSSQACTHFIPKKSVSDFPRMGYGFYLGYPYWTCGIKYLYITDTQIIGHNSNTVTGTYNGIKVTNSNFVLHSVYGV